MRGLKRNKLVRGLTIFVVCLLIALAIYGINHYGDGGGDRDRRPVVAIDCLGDYVGSTVSIEIDFFMNTSDSSSYFFRESYRAYYQGLSYQAYNNSRLDKCYNLYLGHNYNESVLCCFNKTKQINIGGGLYRGVVTTLHNKYAKTVGVCLIEVRMCQR